MQWWARLGDESHLVRLKPKDYNFYFTLLFLLFAIFFKFNDWATLEFKVLAFFFYFLLFFLSYFLKTWKVLFHQVKNFMINRHSSLKMSLKIQGVPLQLEVCVLWSLQCSFMWSCLQIVIASWKYTWPWPMISNDSPICRE